MPSARRVAVIGAGISGLAVAHGLRREAAVTLFEAADYFGGHAHTVDITLDGITHGVDTGFLVLNERTYPKLLALFTEFDVALAPSEMSFSVQVRALNGRGGLEWSGCNLDTVFAQRSNLLRPSFWRMLTDLLRFNRIATALAKRPAQPAGEAADDLDESIAAFLDRHHFGTSFRDGYFLPMLGCIWSCPVDQMLRFPVATMIRFCHNHGLLQISDRPQWFTVRGGSARYVEKIVAGLTDARRSTPVRSVRRVAGGAAGVVVTTDAGAEHFDEVVFACHSDQALALLDDAGTTETEVLGAVRYQRNRAVLHTDVALLPSRRRAWAAWNYERAADTSREQAAVCLHYWLNRLQPLPFTTPVIVSLNPVREPRAGSVLAEFDYAHPVFDAAAIQAQRRVAALQGRGRTWYCGAWTGYGFHEDGLASGLAVSEQLRARWALVEAPTSNVANPPTLVLR